MQSMKANHRVRKMRRHNDRSRSAAAKRHAVLRQRQRAMKRRMVSARP